MTTSERALWLGIILLIFLINTVGGIPHKIDEELEERTQIDYCTNVAIWLAQKDRGLEPDTRNGHSDYKNIAAEVCPGLKPAY